MSISTNRHSYDLAAIREAHPLPSIVGASVKLLRAGSEWKACCPLHSDRSPSFTIFDGGVRFHCFGCGASGDVLDYLQRLHGVSLPEAASMLTGGDIPRVPVRALPVEPERDTTAEAVSIWRSAVPAQQTPVEAYLRGRGLHLPIPPTVRFSRLPYGSRGEIHPCLVALVTSAENKPVGVQRTYLTEEGRKADVPTVKLSLGRIRGAAIRLAPAAAELLVTGALEDALTLVQELGRVTWASAGEGNMASMLLPDLVRSVVIGADNDESGAAHAKRAADAFADQGRRASIIRPAAGFKDFNDELQGGRSS